MKVVEIIQRVQSLYSKGCQSDDTRLSPRHIYSKLISLRSKYISQQAKKKQKINQWNFQTLPCVELIKTDIHNCPCIPPIGCRVLRTKYPLPKPLTDLNRHLIQSVTSLDGTIIFSEIQWDEVKYKASSKYTATKPDFFIRDGYLYLVGLTQRMRHLDIITITGLWEDPLVSYSFIGKCEEGCTDCEDCTSALDKDFPIDGENVDWIISEAAEELISYYNQNKEDLTNDTKDSIIEESK